MDNKINIYPAIDILDGKCVRLFKGDYAQNTVYNFDPVFVAKKWLSLGAEYLHIVDLDGAKTGQPENLEIVKKIARLDGLKVQVGGGIRCLATIKMVLDAGVDKVILGTAAINDKEFAKAALKEFGPKIILGLDCRNGKPAVAGWLENTEISAIDFANELKDFGLSKVIYTDIECDGTLQGPNFDELREFANATQIPTVASGGISSIHDVIKLAELKATGIPLEGVIVGKALYANNIKLDELIATVN